MTTIYLDNNATTQVAPEVLEAMLPYYQDFYGNPSSAYTFGGQVGRKIQEAREQVATLIGAIRVGVTGLSALVAIGYHLI